MNSRPWRLAAVAASAVLVMTDGSRSAPDHSPVRPPAPLEETALTEGELLLVRLDPKRGAPRGACDDLSAQDLTVSIGGVAAKVTSVERVPRPERHWLLLDVSESAEGRWTQIQRSAAQYVRDVMTPGVDTAALVRIDDDVVLAGGPASDPAMLAARIDELPAGGGSALRDGLDMVLRQVSGDRHEHLFLYWTDGEDTGSIGALDELLETLDRTPHATVFPVVLPRSRGGALRPPDSTFLFDVARRSGGEVLAASDPRWLDRVRGWVARRFTVGLELPEEAPKARLAITLRDSRCVATQLHDPFARPAAIAGAAPPAPRSWVRVHARQRRGDDAACTGDSDGAVWEWPWRGEPDALAGCVLDVARLSERFAARDVRVLAPAIAALPRSLDEAIERLLPPKGKPSPFLVSGSALLVQRSRIAASLFAERPDYRDFALSRLARLAAVELASIERDFSHAFPELPPERIAEIARASRAGRRALEASLAPTDADLAGVLAAWLADVPARLLFGAWERRLVDARIASGRDPSVEEKWTALRARLARTDDAHVVAPLILINDAARDLVGFQRVVLPRPGGKGELLEDRVPERPLGLLLVDRIASRPGVGERLAAVGFRAVRIDEEALEPAWRVGTGDPFRRARVTVALEASAGTGRVVLDADVTAGAGGELTIARFAPSVTDVPELAELLERGE